MNYPKYAIGSLFGADLLRALGMDPDRITELHLEGIEVGKIVKLRITRLVSSEEAARMVKIFENYRLVPLSETEDITPYGTDWQHVQITPGINAEAERDADNARTAAQEAADDLASGAYLVLEAG